MSLSSELKPCSEAKDSAEASRTVTDGGNEISDKNSLQDFNKLKRQVKSHFIILNCCRAVSFTPV